MASISIEIVNTGSELLLGRVLNTHQQWLCQEFLNLGLTVQRQVTVPDTGPEIQAAVREALGRADLVVVTGGLGPTSDDRTRDDLADLFGRSLYQNSEVLEHIRSWFGRRGRPMPTRVEIQAMVPEGARVFQNQHGTAPGLMLEVDPNPFQPEKRKGWVLMLPGPPRELRPMFLKQFVPKWTELFPSIPSVACLTLKSTGVGESLMEERLEEPLKPFLDQGLELGFCARTGEVDVRLLFRGDDAREKLAQAEKVVLAHVGDAIFGREEDSLPGAIIAAATLKGFGITCAESCTGGYLAHRLTNIPGASEVFLGGWVTYSNHAKMKCLGVQSATLEAHGAVSEATAREMAEGARKEMGAHYAVSITGIAGPGGGSEEKPQGTVFVGLASPSTTKVKRFLNPFDRETFKFVTTQQALEWLRREILDLPS